MSLRPPSALKVLRMTGIGFAITLAFVPFVLAVQTLFGVKEVHILFLIPVIVAATRYGFGAGLAAALGGAAASAFFVYPPIYSLRIRFVDDALALSIFAVVAGITSHLTALARNHAAAAARNYGQLELLYAFSRKLTAATGPDEIVAAIQAHATALVGRNVFVITLEAGELRSGAAGGLASLSAPVKEAVLRMVRGTGSEGSELVTEAGDGRSWLLKPFSRNARSPGVLIVELGGGGATGLEALRRQIDPLLDEAAWTLERLDLSTTVADAEMRRRTAELREAIVGSTSHSLRTPLASILGSASILASAPAVAGDPRLSALAQIVVSEAERLNGDIQKMLDAATLSGSRLTPDLAWIEPADLVNATLKARHRELEQHAVTVHYEKDLPLVRADAALITNALNLVVDNAARYSEASSKIEISVQSAGDHVVFAVEDEGIGIEPGEASRVFEKFYRGARVRQSTRGTGLGLWIANAFVDVCNGRIDASPRDGRAGTRVTIELPAASAEQMVDLGGSDE